MRFGGESNSIAHEFSMANTVIKLAIFFLLIFHINESHAQESNQSSSTNSTISSNRSDSEIVRFIQTGPESKSEARRRVKRSFANLRDIRADLNADIPRIKSERDSIQHQIDQSYQRIVSAERELIKDRDNIADSNSEVVSLTFEIASKKKSIEDTNFQLKTLRDNNNNDADANRKIDELEVVLVEFQSELFDLEKDVLYYSGEIKRSEAAIVRSNEVIQEANPRLTQLRLDLVEKNQELVSLTDRQFDVENEINLLLIPETAENAFKLYISVIFAGLVAVVILGFFVMAYRDVAVRRAIFSGSSGIQFLTLFSLVIAIILFGITGILEGKELAALLGGISGYILGRVTNDIPPQSTSIGQAQPSPATLPPPEPASESPPNPPAVR